MMGLSRGREAAMGGRSPRWACWASCSSSRSALSSPPQEVPVQAAARARLSAKRSSGPPMAPSGCSRRGETARQPRAGSGRDPRPHPLGSSSSCQQRCRPWHRRLRSGWFGCRQRGRHGRSGWRGCRRNGTACEPRCGMPRRWPSRRRQGRGSCSGGWPAQRRRRRGPGLRGRQPRRRLPRHSSRPLAWRVSWRRLGRRCSSGRRMRGRWGRRSARR